MMDSNENNVMEFNLGGAEVHFFERDFSVTRLCFIVKIENHENEI